ncbi:MAG: hypothetical protein J5803_06390, partial [Desulfovibrio sp.]|nr:hypothetical protein [Desulfovibrio sp.]
MKSYSFEPLFDEAKTLLDVQAKSAQRTIPILGSAGPKREEAILTPFLDTVRSGKDVLPVFLGQGLGYA